MPKPIMIVGKDVDFEVMPDHVTMKSCKLDWRGRVREIVFREPEEIRKLVEHEDEST